MWALRRLRADVLSEGVTAPEEVRFIIGMGILTELEPTVLEA